MDCQAAKNLISARLDGQISAGDDAALAKHLEQCGECRSSAAALAALDTRLRRAVAPRRRAAGAIADQVALRIARTVRPSRRNLALAGCVTAILSAAAGFGGAALWLWPARTDTPARNPIAATAIAHLTLATGPIEVFRPGQQSWTVLATGGAIEPAARVRTGDGSRCEFRTSDGSDVRLNAGGELKFESTRAIELVSGQAWSTVAAAATPFELRTAEATITALGTQFDVARAATGLRVTVIEGSTRVRSVQDEATLTARESVTVADGRIGEKNQVRDLVSATSWVHEILVLKGRDNPELTARIDDLLAQIGATKMDYVYEQEMRTLGDHCVLPLTRYIQSPRSQDDSNKRGRAARILADFAPTWSIPELIALLADTDDEVRFHAARALSRLTGQDLGLTAQAWREAALATRESTIQRWQTWWRQNKQRFPGSDREN